MNRAYHIQGRAAHSNGISKIIDSSVDRGLGLEVCRLKIIDISVRIASAPLGAFLQGQPGPSQIPFGYHSVFS